MSEYPGQMKRASVCCVILLDNECNFQTDVAVKP